MLSIGKGELRAGSELPAQRELAEGFGATNSPFFLRLIAMSHAHTNNGAPCTS